MLRLGWVLHSPEEMLNRYLGARLLTCIGRNADVSGGDNGASNFADHPWREFRKRRDHAAEDRILGPTTYRCPIEDKSRTKKTEKKQRQS